MGYAGICPPSQSGAALRAGAPRAGIVGHLRAHCIGGRPSLGRCGQTEQTGRTDRQDGQTEQTDRTDRQNGERKKMSGPRGPLAAGHAEMFKAS